jgi:hypothetical protein
VAIIIVETWKETTSGSIEAIEVEGMYRLSYIMPLERIKIGWIYGKAKHTMMYPMRYLPP